MKSLLLLIAISLLAFDQPDPDKHGKRFKGGRPMFSSITIDLNNDSTYYLTEWINPYYSTNDTGSWFRTKKDQIILNSTVKNCQKPCQDSSKADYHFIRQKANLQDSVLRLIPKRSRDRDYYADYYALYLEGEY